MLRFAQQLGAGEVEGFSARLFEVRGLAEFEALRLVDEIERGGIESTRESRGREALDAFEPERGSARARRRRVRLCVEKSS